MKEMVQRLIDIKPSDRQLKWHQLKFYAFICFGTNTFYECEWGTGEEDPNCFNPTELDTEQWVRCIKEAGMKGIILTCKHHDGFCLWPSQYTEQSIKNSPYKKGKGDIVGELAQSCKKQGIKLGVYLSPWDMHEATYGTEAYNDYFVNQLTELLTHYGEIFSVWFDGACGEGANGKKQVYDWKRYYETIRKLQPEAVISVCGPDVRWCGNEAGTCRVSEWNVVPKRLADPNYVANHSQQEDDTTFRQRPIKHADQDLGSREILKDEEELIWYPAEVDTSIRPGWYYHESEDDKVRSLKSLLDIYYHSVGGNATLLLNIPPDKRGLIHEKDAKILKEMGDYLTNAFRYNIVSDAEINVTKEDEDYPILNALKEDESFFKTKDGEETVEINLRWKRNYTIKYIVLEEQLAKSQRIEAFEVWVLQDGLLQCVYKGTTVGSRRICKLEGIDTSEIQIRITSSRIAPTLKFLGIYM